MALKCPICGIEYEYSSKICKECEDYSEYSGLSKKGGVSGDQWKCNVFLDSSHLIFSPKYLKNRKRMNLPKTFTINVCFQDPYDWNCEYPPRSNADEMDKTIEYLSESNLSLEELDSMMMEKRYPNPLLYE